MENGPGGRCPLAFPKEKEAQAPADPFWEEQAPQGWGRQGQGRPALTWPLLPFIISENLNLTPKLGSTTLP